jgi:hypothetical protein
MAFCNHEMPKKTNPYGYQHDAKHVSKTASTTSKQLFRANTIGKVLSPVSASGIERNDLDRAVKVVVAEMLRHNRRKQR